MTAAAAAAAVEAEEEAEPRDGADKDPFIPKTVGTAAVIPASVHSVTWLIGGCHGVKSGRPFCRKRRSFKVH